MENHNFSWENPLQMAIFNSYVSLPEGIQLLSHVIPPYDPLDDQTPGSQLEPESLTFILWLITPQRYGPWRVTSGDYKDVSSHKVSQGS